jgi:hypothetical protein
VHRFGGDGGSVTLREVEVDRKGLLFHRRTVQNPEHREQ